MATAEEIVRSAYREANYTAIQADPTDTELTEGLALLQSISDTFHGTVVGVRLMPWYIPWPQKTATVASNYPLIPGDSGLKPWQKNDAPPPNSRIFAKNPEAFTAFLQYQPQDGAAMEYVDIGHEGVLTIDGNGALFGLTGSETEVVIDPTYPAGRNAKRRWVFRGDYGAWLQISSLTLAGDLPYPSEFDDFFITELVIRLSSRFGNDPRAGTLLRNQTSRQFAANQWIQSRPVLVGTPGQPSAQSYRRDNFATGSLF